MFILGAGGHAKMVIEAARSQGAFQPCACLTPRSADMSSVLGLPVLEETDELLYQLAAECQVGFVAIGDNGLRRKLSDKLLALGIYLPAIISGDARVSNSATVGGGSIVMPGAVVGAEAQIGIGAIVNTCSSVDHDCRVAAYSHIGPGCHLAGNVQIGREVFLGIGSAIIPGVSVGDRAIIGAGAVVITDVPNSETWVGCPAKRMRAKSSEPHDSCANQTALRFSRKVG